MRYGIFGGSFDPPHKEHKAICEQVQSELSLDNIVLVPCGNAPHKKNLSPFDKRVGMLEVLFKDNGYIIDTIESELEGLTNTARILPLLKEKYGDIVFIIGGDSMIDMDSWIDPITVMTTCPIAVVTRENMSPELMNMITKYRQLGAEIHLINYVGKHCSSTWARTYARIELPNPYVTEEVSEYITANDLYSEYKAMIKDVRNMVDRRRFAHTQGVVVMALELNEQLNLPYDSVFTAALLHDSCKDSMSLYGDEPLEAYTPWGHGFTGSDYAKSHFHIKDEDVLNAIRYHTTGRANMSQLEKLIYLADIIEYSRCFPGVDDLRDIAVESFEKGFLEALDRQLHYLAEKRQRVCFLTLECYTHYINYDKNYKENLMDKNVKENAKALAEKIAKLLADKQNTNIVMLDVSEKSHVTDYFVIATAKSVTNAKAACEHLQSTLEDEGIFVTRTDGIREGKWIVLDYTTVLVHIFYEELRDFYKLDKLWSEPDESNVTRFMGV